LAVCHGSISAQKFNRWQEDHDKGDDFSRDWRSVGSAMGQNILPIPHIRERGLNGGLPDTGADEPVTCLTMEENWLGW